MERAARSRPLAISPLATAPRIGASGEAIRSSLGLSCDTPAFLGLAHGFGSYAASAAPEARSPEMQLQTTTQHSLSPSKPHFSRKTDSGAKTGGERGLPNASQSIMSRECALSGHRFAFSHGTVSFFWQAFGYCRCKI